MVRVSPAEIYRNGASPWVRHILTALPLVIAGTWALSGVSSDAEDALDKAQKNGAEIEAIKRDLGTIKTNQAVIQNQLKNENEKNQTFRDDTGRALDRILRKLDNAQPDGGGVR